MKTFYFLSFLFLWIFTVTQTFADEIDDAISKKDYATAYKLLLPLAEKGIASDQFRLGKLLSEGHGDHNGALKWLKKAKQQGIHEASAEMDKEWKIIEIRYEMIRAYDPYFDDIDMGMDFGTLNSEKVSFGKNCIKNNPQMSQSPEKYETALKAWRANNEIKQEQNIKSANEKLESIKDLDHAKIKKEVEESINSAKCCYFPPQGMPCDKMQKELEKFIKPD